MSIARQFRRKSANLGAILKYPYILQQLRPPRRLFFFFPFWQLGGGERVHADILEAVSGAKPLCFLTERSVDDGFKKEFRKNATVIRLGQWADKRSFKPFIREKIAGKINELENPVVFGCHSRFFYELIPHLADHVKIIDLTHAFTYNPDGPEIYSLPHVQRLDNRVILGEKTKNDFRQLYRDKGISADYLDRFVIIPNKVNAPDQPPQKDHTGKLNVLFVSRDAEEKRPGVFFRITEQCFEKQLPVEFTVIGNFSHMKGRVRPNTTIAGEIFDREKLDEHYRQAHIILVTSWREGFPMVMLEGMSRGVIPVSTDVGEIPAWISADTHRNGFLVENEEDINNISLKFAELLGYLVDNRDILPTYSKNAWSFVRKHFNPERFSRAYRDLLAGPGTTR